jgi:hypothetical protein
MWILLLLLLLLLDIVASCSQILFFLFVCSAMTLICVVSAMVFPLVFLLDLKPADRQLIASVSIAMVTMASLGIMFWPKVLAVFEGQDLNWSLLVSAVATTTGKLSRGSPSVSRNPSVSASENTTIPRTTYRKHAEIIPEDELEDKEEEAAQSKAAVMAKLGPPSGQATETSVLVDTTLDGVVHVFEQDISKD